MTDDQPEEEDESSFRERVEEIRQEQAEREEGDEGRPGLGEMMGGGGGGGMGGGNPFAQMMGGMMGGGPGGGPGGAGDIDSERIARELGQLREEVTEVGTQLERIADALEED